MSVEHYPAGDAAPWPQVGDFILCHRPGVAPALIRFGQNVRFRGARRRFAYWNHAALVVSPEGDLVEALIHGVQRSHLDKYRDTQYTLVRTNTDQHDQEQVHWFAEQLVGEDYGFVTIVCASLTLLTGVRFSFALPSTPICSGLVARARERAGDYYGRNILPHDALPAHLAEHWDATRPTR